MNRQASRSTAGIIIAQYGQGAMTGRCVASLQRFHPDVAIHIVDDGSPDVCDRRALQQARWSNVTVHALAYNGGVTRAWNAGAEACIRLHNLQSLVFLNSDVISYGPWLPRLLAPLDDAHIKLTGPAMRAERSLPAGLLSQLPASQFLEGWCVALRTETFLHAGGFDSAMRLYFSDTDLQCRLLSEGGRLHAVDELPLIHLGHQSTRTHPERSQQWGQDRAHFIAKWQSRSAAPSRTSSTAGEATDASASGL